MNIESRRSGEVIIFELSGNLVLGAGDVKLRSAVQNALLEGKLRIVLNLKEVHLIDSTGIGEIMSAHTALDKRGGKLKLCNLGAKAAEILRITGLQTIIETYDTEELAVAAF